MITAFDVVYIFCQRACFDADLNISYLARDRAVKENLSEDIGSRAKRSLAGIIELEGDSWLGQVVAISFEETHAVMSREVQVATLSGSIRLESALS